MTEEYKDKYIVVVAIRKHYIHGLPVEIDIFVDSSSNDITTMYFAHCFGCNEIDTKPF